MKEKLSDNIVGGIKNLFSKETKDKIVKASKERNNQKLIVGAGIACAVLSPGVLGLVAVSTACIAAYHLGASKGDQPKAS